jgi:hypothetical protein
VTVIAMGHPTIDLATAMRVAEALGVPPAIAAELLPALAAGAAEGFAKREKRRDGDQGDGDDRGQPTRDL